MDKILVENQIKMTQDDIMEKLELKKQGVTMVWKESDYFCSIDEYLKERHINLETMKNYLLKVG